MTESKKSRAYKLFSEGKKANSPEVKALGLKQGSRYGYYSKWNQEGRPDHIIHTEIVASASTQLDGGETVGGYVETEIPVKAETPVAEAAPVREILESVEDEEDSEEAEAPGEETKPKIEESPEGGKSKIELGLDGNDKQSVSADVVGFGLPVRVNLSIKTLALYQIAASRSGDGLTLGDFLDSVAADYFQGRGRDLGLIEMEVKNVG